MFSGEKLKLFKVCWVALLFCPMLLQANEKVKFGTNWVAQAEHGGFYQAFADGTYAACGLDVEIVPGGPNVNNRALLLAGRIDFMIDGNLLQSFNARKESIPLKVIASIFQREPQILITHPGQGLDTWESLKTAPVLFIGNGGFHSYFQWMKSIGFSDSQRRPYHFNSAPFLANRKSGQQGYITAEPFVIEQIASFTPNVFLLADYGFDTYSTMLVTMEKTLQNKSDVVQCFVDGSIIGWVNFLYGDRNAAVTLIKEDNADITDRTIQFAIDQMKKYGIVDSGDSLTLGIGAMTNERVQNFYQKMVIAKVVKPGLDFGSAYTLEYINKGVGLDLKKKLAGL